MRDDRIGAFFFIIQHQLSKNELLEYTFGKVSLRGDIFMASFENLSKLRPDSKAVILENNASEFIKTRLNDIGLIEGTEVECVGRSPTGGISAFLIRGATIAIRDEDSCKIVIREVIQNAEY